MIIFSASGLRALAVLGVNAAVLRLHERGLPHRAARFVQPKKTLQASHCVVKRLNS